MPARQGNPTRQEQHLDRLGMAHDPSRNSRSNLLPPFPNRSDRRGTWGSLSRRAQRTLIALASLSSLLLMYFVLLGGSDNAHVVIAQNNDNLPVNKKLPEFAAGKPHSPHGHHNAIARATVTHTQTQTVYATKTTTVPAPTKALTAPSSTEPVVFVLIMISADSASEGAILLKVSFILCHAELNS